MTKIKIIGAAREVTGSCFLLSHNNNEYLIDCGLYQGSRESDLKNLYDFSFDPKKIKAIFVTHAHLDHVGRIPILIKKGFNGKIFATKATIELMALILDDAYSVMNSNYMRYGSPVLYSQDDVDKALSLCHGIDYHKSFMVDNLQVNYKDAGHVFGAAFIEFMIDNKKIVFSGDLGNENVPILRDTEKLENADFLVCESTYGDRIHETNEVRKEILLRLIKTSISQGGTMMIPSFSLERTHELLYEFNYLSEHDKTLPKVPFFLDGPLAIKMLAIYKKYPEYFDENAYKLFKSGDDFLQFPQLKNTITPEESKSINYYTGPKIIIAGSGMMTGGRILHHAKRYLSDSRSTLLIVGYQAEGTLGRRLYEGAEKVQIHNEIIPVNCTIKAIGALSAHGDQPKLLNWISNSQATIKKIICVHGEPNAATTLAHKIKSQFNISAIVPERNEEFEI